jgi:para-nitrobenzyl esterase
VVVWIYGGGFVNGGSSPPTYAGADLASRGVVFVSFNYRVGRFGTFAHPQLTRANADNGRIGNYAIMDQSAGGMSVNTLLTSPQAEGLFRGAIIMSSGSPTAPAGPASTLVAVEKIGVDFAAGKGIASNNPHALAKLRALSADAVTDGLNLMALFRPTPGPATFAMPFVDGKVTVANAPALQSGQFAKVPVMIGATSDDIGGKTGNMVGGARRAASREPRAASKFAAQGAPAYGYRFSYVAESISRPGAGHATDIPLFLDTQDVKYEAKTTARDNAMGATIAKYVVNFVKTGDPNGQGLPTWPRYSPASDVIMDFTADGQAVARRDPWGAELDAVKPGARPSR